MKYRLYCDAAISPRDSLCGYGCVLYRVLEDGGEELAAYLSDYANKKFVEQNIANITAAEMFAVAEGINLCHYIVKSGDELTVYTDNITVYEIIGLGHNPPLPARYTYLRFADAVKELLGVNIKYEKEMRGNNHAADAFAFAAFNAALRETKGCKA